MSFTLILPTLNAASYWQAWLESYQAQSIKANKVVIIDSSSSDSTRELAEQVDFFVKKIAKSEFNHGGTRNLAAQFADNAEILVFMTQDALLANTDSLENLLKAFDDPDVAAVCGRQLPHNNANPLATHARLFNYPTQNQVKSQLDIAELGIKVAFMSNSFAAYRRSVFEKLGGFPNNTILAEDMCLAGKMILAGYKVAYCAEAKVYHSHNYSLKQEFQRYFDTGVFQSCEPWIQQQFGNSSNEGKKFVLSEWRYLLENAPFWLPKSVLSIFCKYVGFKLGLYWQKLPSHLCHLFSMHKNYWKNKK